MTATLECQLRYPSVGADAEMVMIPLSPQALLTGKISWQMISCNLVPDNYRDKFQLNQLVIHYRFLTGTLEKTEPQITG